jgi:uncharacterized membrane protein YeaQ/YmgE (transglycosylase-associated protein family)
MDMFQIIWWIIVGLIVGLLARFILPGRDPMGWIATLLLGIAGSMVGGLISMVLFDATGEGFRPAGFLLSLLGAVLLLLLWRKVRPGTTVG